MHRIFSILAVVTLTFFSQQVACGKDNSAARPNVLFIAVDDLNDWALQLGNYTAAKTPHLNGLADRGVLFTNAHCAAPACNPSRTSVITGVAPSTSGVYLNQQDWRECSRLKDITTLPEHFRNNGYKVLGGGKIYHASNLSERGLTGLIDAEPWDAYFPSKTRQLPDKLMPPDAAVNGSNKFYRGRFDWAQLDIDDAEMGDGKVVYWAQQQLGQQHDKPLFLAVGLYRPHIPWHTPRKWFAEYPLGSINLPQVETADLQDVPPSGQTMARRNWHQWIVANGKWQEAVQAYLASVSFADAMVGELLQALADGPLADNTIVVLWSDHGYHLGHKEHWEKFALWEQTTHVPLIFFDPRSANGGQRCESPASLLDIYPTLSELCGLAPPKHLDGQSLVPNLAAPASPTDRAVLITHGFGNHAVRSQRWRYIRYANGGEELYDHRTDPHEFQNLAHKTELREVITKLALHLPSADAPVDPASRDQKKSQRKKQRDRLSATNSLFYVSASKEDQLYAYSLDRADGSVTLLNKTSLDGSPGTMCADFHDKRLYVALKSTGAITSFRVKARGELVAIGETVVGAAPSYLSLHPSKKFLLSSYYAAGQAAVHRIQADGSLSPTAAQVLKTDEKAHCIALAPSGRFAFVPHTRPNSIFQFRFDEQTGKLIANSPDKLTREFNSGPRHLWFHPNGKYAFGSDEQGSSVTAYQFNAQTGLLSKLATYSSLPAEGYEGTNSTSDIEVHPTGKFLFIANRGHDTLAGFSIQPETGQLELIGHTPTEKKTRSFNISPDGQYLVAAGQGSNKLAVFQLGKNGSLERIHTIPTGKSPHWVQFAKH